MANRVLLLSVAFLLISTVRCVADDHHNQCMGSILNGFYYCAADSQCNSITGECSGDEYDTARGCPTNTICSAGNGGSIHIGSPSLDGGVGLAGSVNFEAPSNEPCIVTFFNDQQSDIDLTLQGTDVGVQYLAIDFPYSTSTSKETNYRITTSANVVHAYVGSKTDSSNQATISWKLREVVVPTSAAYLSVLTAFVLSLTYLMF